MSGSKELTERLAAELGFRIDNPKFSYLPYVIINDEDMHLATAHEIQLWRRLAEVTAERDAAFKAQDEEDDRAEVNAKALLKIVQERDEARAEIERLKSENAVSNMSAAAYVGELAKIQEILGNDPKSFKPLVEPRATVERLKGERDALAEECQRHQIGESYELGYERGTKAAADHQVSRKQHIRKKHPRKR